MSVLQRRGVFGEFGNCCHAKLPILMRFGCFGVGVGARHFVGEVLGVGRVAYEHCVHVIFFSNGIRYFLDLLGLLRVRQS